MKMLRKGCISEPDWKAVVQCTGEGYKSDRKACYSALEIDLDDIVHFYYLEGKTIRVHYAFFCSNCHRVTIIPDYCIPAQFRNEHYFPKVVTDDMRIYVRLSEEEEAFSASYTQYL